MYVPSPSGFHTKLDQAAYDAIIENAEIGITNDIVAGLAGIPPTTLRMWLKRGLEERIRGELTIFAQLSKEFTQRVCKKQAKWIKDLDDGREKWQASLELLHHTNKKEFGKNAEITAEIEENLERLLERTSNGNSNSEEKKQTSEE